MDTGNSAILFRKDLQENIPFIISLVRGEMYTKYKQENSPRVPISHQLPCQEFLQIHPIHLHEPYIMTPT